MSVYGIITDLRPACKTRRRRVYSSFRQIRDPSGSRRIDSRDPGGGPDGSIGRPFHARPEASSNSLMAKSEVVKEDCKGEPTHRLGNTSPVDAYPVQCTFAPIDSV